MVQGENLSLQLDQVHMQLFYNLHLKIHNCDIKTPSKKFLIN